MCFAVMLVLAQVQMVDPADWSYQHLSARGKARFIQVCRGPGDCVAEAFDTKRDKKLWSTAAAIGPRPETMIADDGISVVRITVVLPIESPGEIEAIAFYRRGKKLRGWLVRELIDSPDSLPTREQARGWVGSSKFAEDGKHFEIRLVNGADASFSLETGERKTNRPAPKRDP